MQKGLRSGSNEPVGEVLASVRGRPTGREVALSATESRSFSVVSASFCDDSCMQKKGLSKTNTKVPFSSHYPPVKCSVSYSFRLRRFRLRRAQVRGTRPWIFTGRSSQKVGLFQPNLQLSTRGSRSLSNAVSMSSIRQEFVEKLTGIPRRGDDDHDVSGRITDRSVLELFSAHRASTRLKVGPNRGPTAPQER